MKDCLFACPRGHLAGPRSPLSSAWESPRPDDPMTDSAEVKTSFRGRQQGPWDRAHPGAQAGAPRVRPPPRERCGRSPRASLTPRAQLRCRVSWREDRVNLHWGSWGSVVIVLNERPLQLELRIVILWDSGFLEPKKQWRG